MTVNAAIASLLALSCVSMALLMTTLLLRGKRLAGRPSSRERAVGVALAISLGITLSAWGSATWFVLTHDLGEDHALTER